MKTFEEFIEEGIIRKQSPDISRAKSLRKEAADSYMIISEYLTKIPLSDTNANHVIKNVYDIIMELIRASMLEHGYYASGSGAHEAEVTYLAKIGYSPIDVEFADRLRYFRNGITYYGKSFDAQYAKKVMIFLEKMKDIKQRI